ncbi:AraC family transcriptional regulator [uncultured Limosilactobacillus sp.]|uniref:AraC family transcriptional regulator n=1 Tax=uncultured Limosilactobacillus sp. TaxID=2837629 RepID=UPI0025CCEA46|nr:AraC family transcriptional regulator [uncultured Limosilactobacillus sp.]
MEKLRKLLLQEDPIEKQQRLNHGQNINYMGLGYGPGIIPRIPRSNFFQHSWVAATKQHRYSYMPAHTHSFIEFNYQFSGQSIQQLNGREYILQAGELLVMDQSLIQRYGYMGTDDLLVNVLLDIEQLPANFISDIRPANGLIRFLYNSLDQHADHNDYLIYDLTDYPETIAIWEELMYYALSNVRPYETRQLLMETALSCLPDPQVTHMNVSNPTDRTINDVMRYINQHFATVSLAEVSQHFNYNKNYLGNKLKQNTGMSFGELLDRKRLLTAESLLLDTDWTTAKIAEQLGYQNTSSLFRLFQNQVGMTPARFRQIHRGELN